MLACQVERALILPLVIIQLDGGATLSGVTLDPETAVADKSLYYDFALVDGTTVSLRR